MSRGLDSSAGGHADRSSHMASRSFGDRLRLGAPFDNLLVLPLSGAFALAPDGTIASPSPTTCTSIWRARSAGNVRHRALRRKTRPAPRNDSAPRRQRIRPVPTRPACRGRPQQPPLSMIGPLPAGRCWLKNVVARPVADANTVSGVKFKPASVRID
jgi:hypothetical protein